MVEETLKPFASGQNAADAARMAEIETQLGGTAAIAGLPDSIPVVREYAELRAKAARGVDLAGLEADVYSALYSFFNRYYDDGDFISKRRYKEGVYAIPYEGEEVKLYWANQDQYYIKTTENFKDYTFVTPDGITVHFRLVDATTEQNNNKETGDNKRQFMLFTEDEERFPGVKPFAYDAQKREFIVRFVFDIPADKKVKYPQVNYAAIKQWITGNADALIAPLLTNTSSDPKKPMTLLLKHLTAYVAKNTFDYFIHKDLGGFLRRELDFYIKNEIMHLDDLDTEREERVEAWLAKVKVIKRVGHVIIDFLAQIEDFQKKLWLKKKFVVETNWCITLDRIDEKFWPEIVQNKAQVAEWIAMYAIDEAEGWTNPPTVDFLRQNQNLVADTKHFSAVFKDRLVASIDHLDEQTGGLMIWSENFQALELMLSKYRSQAKCIYIDPPYNAKSSEILYKNTYKHAAWLSSMNDRIALANQLLCKNGVSIIAIDEIEQTRLGELLRMISPEQNISAVTVIHNPSGQQGDNLSFTNEFAYFTYPNIKNVLGLETRGSDDWDTRTFRDNSGNSNLRTDAANCFYPIFVRSEKIVGFGDVCADDYHPVERNVELSDDTIAVFPIDNNGVEKKWVFERGTVEGIVDELWVTESTQDDIEIMRTKKRFRYKSTWTDKKYSANSYGSALLTAMAVPFSYPKSIYNVLDCVNCGLSDQKEGIVFDYFAGSGTTAHAILYQNNADKGNRKYVLAEMGNYFSIATLNRVKKAIYAVHPQSWKKGKPVNRNTGVSHIMKYIRLESYEDALSNIVLDTARGDLLAGMFGDEYFIHYMMDTETAESVLDVNAFADPFAYRMKITQNNEAQLRPVDVAETFNYLIGLTVIREGEINWFRADVDHHDYEGSVRLTRDDGGEFAFRQIEGTLPDGRRALVIWRNVTKDMLKSNAALDAYFAHYRVHPADRAYDVIYVNGDNNLENIRTDSEDWKVVTTETEFKQKMFEEE